MTKIEMKIENKLTGETKTFETSARRQTIAMFKLMSTIRQYANKDWKIIEVASDSVHIINGIAEQKPNIKTRLL